MGLPPGRARAFETAGKQGCDCVAWSRKRRTGFISRQGVYECPRPSSYAELWDKVSQTDSHTYEKNRRIFLSKLKWAGSHFRAFPPWLPISKDGRDCQRRRMKCAVHLDRWLARLALLFTRQTWIYFKLSRFTFLSLTIITIGISLLFLKHSS